MKALLTSTVLGNYRRPDFPFAIMDARQRRHLEEANRLIERIRQLPRFGATQTSLALQMEVQRRLLLSRSTVDEEAMDDIRHHLLTISERVIDVVHDKMAFDHWAGYGAHYENDIFAMRPFCYCDEDEVCDDCAGGDQHDCRGPSFLKRHPNFWHKASGLRVFWYKYIGRGMQIYGDGDWPSIVDECLVSMQREGTS